MVENDFNLLSDSESEDAMVREELEAQEKELDIKLGGVLDETVRQEKVI